MKIRGLLGKIGANTEEHRSRQDIPGLRETPTLMGYLSRCPSTVPRKTGTWNSPQNRQPTVSPFGSFFLHSMKPS